MDLINQKTFREFIVLNCLKNNSEGVNIHQLLASLNDFFKVDEVELFLSLQKLLKEGLIKGLNNSEKMQVFYVLSDAGQVHHQRWLDQWDGLQAKLHKLTN